MFVRILCLLLSIFISCSPALAENPLKKLFDRLGEELQDEIDKSLGNSNWNHNQQTLPQPVPQQNGGTLPRLGGVPVAGTYYYSGYQDCGPERRYLQARVVVSSRQNASVRFAFRKVDGENNPRQLGEGSFTEYETFGRYKDGYYRHGLRRTPNKILAEGGFSDRGTLFVGRWFESDGQGRLKCGPYTLVLSQSPPQVYQPISKVLARQNPERQDALQVVAFEKTRPPRHWLAKNPNYPSSRLYKYTDAYSAFWRRYLETAKSKLKALTTETATDRERGNRVLDDWFGIAAHWSDNRKLAFATQYELIERFQKRQFDRLGAVVPFKDRALADRCRRLGMDHGKQALQELSRRFANPVTFWTADSEYRYAETVQACRNAGAAWPSVAREYERAASLLDRHKSDLAKLRSNVRWLLGEARRLKQIEPTFEGMVAAKGYMIPKAMLDARGIDDDLHTLVIVRQTEELLRRGMGQVERKFEADFRKQSFETMKPVQAVAYCEKDFRDTLDPPLSVGDEVIINLCTDEAEKYAKRVSAERIEALAADVKAMPANLKSFQETDWYALDSDFLAEIPPSLHQEMKQSYNQKIAGHWNKTVSNVVRDVKAAYAKAVPFEQSERYAVSLCQHKARMPKSYDQACEEAAKAFEVKKRQARCDRAVDRFNASSSMLEETIYIGGSRLNGVPIRKVVCEGANRQPGLSARLAGGGFRFWENPRIEIRNGSEEMVLSLELEERSYEDNRSFLKYLFDIATGANETRQTSYWRGARVLDTSLSGSNYRNPEIALACVYGYLNCNQ